MVITKMPNIDGTLNVYLKEILSQKNLIGIRKLLKKNIKNSLLNQNLSL